MNPSGHQTGGNQAEAGALKAVFLDRDGVLNRAIMRGGKPYAAANLHELEIPPDVPEALAALKRCGFLLLVITNQPDVARGTQQRAIVESINERLRALLPIDDFFVCYHDDSDGCRCRKPKPGLLLQAAVKYRLDLTACYLIGDRWRDIEAGQAAGCATAWIDHSYAERGPSKPATVRTLSFGDAAQWILQNSGCNNLT
jgi:D-glycero-D-manno-heptose 1,7-bisphosphate phosphatase